MSSPAGRRSTVTGMHPPTVQVAAAHAAAHEAAGKQGLETVQTGMGNLEEIQFEAEAEDFYDSVDGLKAAMESDTVSSSQVQALLNLLATEAKGEVRSVAQAVETSNYSVLAAKDASVNELKRSAKLLQADKDEAIAMIKRQKISLDSERFRLRKGFRVRKGAVRPFYGVSLRPPVHQPPAWGHFPYRNR